MKKNLHNKKEIFIRIFFSIFVPLLFVSVIENFYPSTELPVEIFIGLLIFIIFNTALKVTSIEDILDRILRF